MQSRSRLAPRPNRLVTNRVAGAAARPVQAQKRGEGKPSQGAHCQRTPVSKWERPARLDGPTRIRGEGLYIEMVGTQRGEGESGYKRSSEQPKKNRGRLLHFKFVRDVARGPQASEGLAWRLLCPSVRD